MPAILFVCTANICRSPIAVALMKKILNERADADQWIVESAGTWGLDGRPAAEGSRRVVAEMGMDISAHRARTVTRELLKRFDIVLTMEAGHKEALMLEFPEARNRIFQLSELVNHFYDIPDPIGQPLTNFQETADEMDKILRDGLEKLLRILENPRDGQVDEY